MKQLTINWLDLDMAFSETPGEFGYPVERSNDFDLETGQVVFIDEQVGDHVSSIIDDIDEILDDGVDWTKDDVRRSDTFQTLPDLVKPSVLAAIQMEYGDDPSRFEAVPHFDSHDAYQWMEVFVETVRNDEVRGRLGDALQQRKPFRRFRDAIGSDRRLQRQWPALETARQRETMIDWLYSIDVEPSNPKETTYDPPPLPDLRKIMFAELRRFVRFARDIPGVQRMALIRSLATDKEFPKDIDVLVTIRDDCDLTELARLGRQLAGHMTSHSAGGDVFLVSAAGEYLGRTCPWKDCGPGYRASCDALVCGSQ